MATKMVETSRDVSTRRLAAWVVKREGGHVESRAPIMADGEDEKAGDGDQAVQRYLKRRKEVVGCSGNAMERNEEIGRRCSRSGWRAPRMGIEEVADWAPGALPSAFHRTAMTTECRSKT